MKDTTYRFQACAYSEGGEGPMTPIVSVTTKQDGPFLFLGRCVSFMILGAARTRFLKQGQRQSTRVQGDKVSPVTFGALAIRHRLGMDC